MTGWLKENPTISVGRPLPPQFKVGSLFEIRRYPRTRWWWKPWTWRRRQRVIHDLRRIVAISDDRCHIEIEERP